MHADEASPDAAVPARPASRSAKVFGPVAFVSLVAVSLALFVAARRVREHGVLAPAGRPLGPFALTDDAGRRLDNEALRGKVWVASFFRTSCEATCPLLMSHLSRYAEFAAKHAKPGAVAIVSVSVDPARDDVAALRAWSARWHADPAIWHFATAPRDELDRTLASYLTPGTAPPDARTAEDAMRRDRLLLVDGKTRVRGDFEDSPDGIDALERATAAVLAEDAR